MYETRNDLPPKLRQVMSELLNTRLADAIDLRTRVKVAHWNVKGLNFIGLHELLDDIAEAVDDYADLLGERIAQLGGIADGVASDVAEHSELAAFVSPAWGDQQAQIGCVASALADFVAGTRAAIKASEDAGDSVTSDILIDISRGTDKWLWFIEAHVQGLEARPGQGVHMSEQPLEH